MKPIYKIILITLAALVVLFLPQCTTHMTLGQSDLDGFGAYFIESFIGVILLILPATVIFFIWLFWDDMESGAKSLWNWLDVVAERFKKDVDKG